MTRHAWRTLGLLLVALPALAQVTPTTGSREAHSQLAPTEHQRLARDWGLRDEEWSRYRALMKGPLGVYSPNLDPLSVLGIEARSDAERQRYAELQVHAEARRVEKLLAYQRAYDDAWRRLKPDLARVNLPATAPPDPAAANGARQALFVKADCTACTQWVQGWLATRKPLDLYLVGSRQDDRRIREWAQRVGIDPARVRSGAITLNHDAGRWLSLGLSGELPAVVRQVDGQWQRQP
ncbi:integrating conjugative element protein, PFL_4693 family [Delftia tsuruhatensis]|uniref:TIGR03759 family integrating conjugative element protein n=1 Tax=Delftia tsuruhatensis TaxID=180282 RepID=UPI001E7BF86D|nr:TIGR03759 family integrating conjugative element protein [Delftia tsuruhatensis]CAB5670789.1 integrating conjugative element protein, PFL_4693 family [Delftia tsuruhatensis]CAC9683082.1 integrating conjugative element protein, PFL_4693 family [Delftia tsuruhatensis]